LGPFYLDDARLAARIVAALHPYRGYWAHVYTIVTGPVVLYLAMCLLGGLAAVLALVAGLALVAARRTSRRARVGQAA
jgi:hypothetical protein